jgi:acyl-CoA synthetase (AMP-forming)/AMP-acid ligase II
MKTQPNRPKSIRGNLSRSPGGSRFLWGTTASLSIAGVLGGTSLGCRLADLAGRSILIFTQDQLATALAVIELDGVAGRIVICPPDIRPDQLPFVIAKSGVDTIVTDYALDHPWFPNAQEFRNLMRVVSSPAITPAASEPMDHCSTEWVLLSSGTTGAPKMIVHNFANLTAAIDMAQNQGNGVVWGTFYDIRRYGGLQIFLRAVLGRGSLVLSSADEPVADHLARLSAHAVTHLSGTPSHWRRTLMSPQAGAIAPQYVRLSGEIADQAILNSLQAFYPHAAVGHAFASTEAGVAFEVNDGLAGFPASLLGNHGDVEMKIVNDSLRIRSNRTASRYLDGENGVLADQQGFVDTGDVVELRGDRYHFLGRHNGVINVGGLKVYPEEVEAVINRHPAVRMSMVRSRKNPILGALVSADIVLKEGHGSDLRKDVLDFCRQSLAPHKIPATIRCVPTLDIAAAGKLARQHA